MTTRQFEVARAAYDGYNENRQVPDFENIEDSTQRKWLHAAEAVLRQVSTL